MDLELAAIIIISLLLVAFYLTLGIAASNVLCPYSDPKFRLHKAAIILFWPIIICYVVVVCVVINIFG